MLRPAIAGLTLCLLAVGGCQKQEPRTVYIDQAAPVPRPMADLKPAAAEPVKPVASAGTATTWPTTTQPASGQGMLRTYTVRKNDTLWSIAKRHLGDGKRWKEILVANPDLEPARLLPDTVIKLPPQ